jgi:hypothetical protein
MLNSSMTLPCNKCKIKEICTYQFIPINISDEIWHNENKMEDIQAINFDVQLVITCNMQVTL